ncbi:MAG: ketopantoate reductase family protein, partial [Mariprofundus sp.]
MLRVGIAGAGAVGCHYGSFLQQSGMEVAYLARGEHLAALKKHGLTHISNGEARHLQVQASDDSSILTACDVVLFACKTTVLDELCKQISPAIKSTALLISMQNG